MNALVAMPLAGGALGGPTLCIPLLQQEGFTSIGRRQLACAARDPFAVSRKHCTLQQVNPTGAASSSPSWTLHCLASGGLRVRRAASGTTEEVKRGQSITITLGDAVRFPGDAELTLVLICASSAPVARVPLPALAVPNLRDTATGMSSTSLAHAAAQTSQPPKRNRAENNGLVNGIVATGTTRGSDTDNDDEELMLVQHPVSSGVQPRIQPPPEKPASLPPPIGSLGQALDELLGGLDASLPNFQNDFPEPGSRYAQPMVNRSNMSATELNTGGSSSADLLRRGITRANVAAAVAGTNASLNRRATLAVGRERQGTLYGGGGGGGLQPVPQGDEDSPATALRRAVAPESQAVYFAHDNELLQPL